MGLKLLAGVTAAALVLPAVALLSVAVLVVPSASGSTECMDQASNTSVAVAGSVPTSLTSSNSSGIAITLSETQLERAATIIAVGNAEHVPARAQLIALMAALTESSLRVLSNTDAVPSSGQIPNDGDGGDHDSLGLFQMRPSTGWGSPEQLMDPVWSSRAFYGGPDGPNHGSPRGLLDLDGWQQMDPGAAAQAVEVSAYPDRYAVNEPVAAKLLTNLTGANLDTSGCDGSTSGNVATDLPPGFAGAFIAAAAKEIGLPYVWGGGTFDGPTGGGLDCSGLVLYAAYQASGGRIRLPHYTGDQIHFARLVAWGDRQPGDLIFFGYPGASGPHHVAIYIGGDRILQAPHTGDVVRYGTVGEFAGQTMTVRRLG
ncbi:MAG: C40 family peptidase [Solirubrobacteraceae bacterium]